MPPDAPLFVPVPNGHSGLLLWRWWVLFGALSMVAPALPRNALPICPHYSLTSESAKSISLGLGFFTFSVDIPGGVSSLILR